MLTKLWSEVNTGDYVVNVGRVEFTLEIGVFLLITVADQKWNLATGMLDQGLSYIVRHSADVVYVGE